MPKIRTILALLLSAASFSWALAGDEDEKTRVDWDERGIEYWIEYLDDDQFARRQVASRQLLRMGRDAVPALLEVAQSGKLELTQRAIDVLSSLAVEQPPDDDGGAWEALMKLAGRGSGSVAIRARAAIDDIGRQRETQAYEKLAAAGVQIGHREFVIHARSFTPEVVTIDKKWRGDPETLQWLRWVKRIEHALIEGDAVREEVLNYVAKMPDLRTIVLREATVRDDIFTPLAKLSRIDEIELRYIALSEDALDKIADLPIRVSLGLVGTGLPSEAADELRVALPGVNVLFKQGGFLGVTCSNLSPRCQIDGVKVGSAAAAAGLEAGDVVIQINEEPIANFEDLQKQVGSRAPGEKLKIIYDRRGEIGETEVTLGRLDGQ